MRTSRINTGATRPAMFLGVPLVIAVVFGMGVFLSLIVINAVLVGFFGPSLGYLSIPTGIFGIGWFMWARQTSKTDPWALEQRKKKIWQRKATPASHVKRWNGVSYSPSQVIDWEGK